MTAAATLEAVGGSSAETPSAEKGPTADEAVRRHAILPTDLGDLTLVAEGGAVVGVYFPDHRPAPASDRFGDGVDPVGDPVLEDAAGQVVDYVGGRRTTFDLPLHPTGSERARQVWDLIAAVPRGETTSYAALGRAVGVGPRAAGQFVARNPLCVIVPCHRVVASDGRLTGYAGGIDRKRQLLELEGALTPAAPVTPSGPVEAPDAPGGRRMSGLDQAYGTSDSHLERLLDRLVATADQREEVDVGYRTVDGPVGPLLLAATSRGLVRVAFASEGEEAVLQELADRVSPRVLPLPARLDETARELDEYFGGRRRRFDVPLDWTLSTGFRRDVLGHLAVDVEYGRTTSYAGLAALSGSPRAVRAVGTACATNPIPVVVPCHRVVRSDGSMGRYRGGEEAKHALLELEGVR